MPGAVINTWKEIWANDQTLNRAYQSDFEVYGSKSQNGQDSEVDIYIGLK
jgi:predicted transcriptional regulator YdeE